jgi:hypothetical protein
MATSHPSQKGFTGGVISPLMLSRSDIEQKYAASLAECENFYITPQGPVKNRSGSRTIFEVKDSSKFTRIIPFQYSDEESFNLVFNDGSIWFFTEGSVVTETGQSIVSVTLSGSDPVELEVTGHSYSDGDFIVPDGITGDLSSINGIRFEVINSTVNTIELANTDSSDYTTGSGGTVARIYSISHPYSDDDITQENLHYSQSADILYLTHKDFPIKEVSRITNVNWTFTDKEMYDGPYTRENTDTANKLYASATGPGSVTVTADAATFESTDADAGDPSKQRHIRLADETNGSAGWGRITAFTSATEVTVEVVDAFPTTVIGSGNKTKKWRLGAFNETAGYPKSSSFFQLRQWFTGNREEPQGVWASKTNDFGSFSPTEFDGVVLDSNGIYYPINSTTVNAIQWLAANVVMLFGSNSQEWRATGGTSVVSAMTPSSVNITPQSNYGSKSIKPILAQSSLFFIQDSGVRLREMQYNFEIDSYVSEDATIMAEHILREGGGVVDMAYQQEPNSMIWMLLADGTFATITYEKSQNVYAWAKHKIGGSFGSGDAVVESIGCIPDSGTNRDVLYMIVKRTINGFTKRTVEFIEKDFHPADDTDYSEMWFLDSFVEYNGASITEMDKLDHLEGEEVTLVIDGANRGTATVSGGKVTLPSAGTQVIAGLSYRSYIKTLPIYGGNQFGQSEGKRKRIDTLSVRLYNTLEYKHGSTLDSLDTKSFRATSDPMDSSPPFFTGDKELRMKQSYETLAQYYVVQDAPYPLTILSLSPKLKVYK